MKQTWLNITMNRDIHGTQDGKIGVLTSVQYDKQLPDGNWTSYRSLCAYEIKSAKDFRSELRKLRHFKYRRAAYARKARRAA